MHSSDASRVDVALVERIRARDEQALGELYDRHSRLLFGLILRVLRNRAEAEEVLQEAFVLAWSKAETYDASLGTPAAWLVRIARNRAIDRLRSNQVRERTVDALAPAGGGERMDGPAVSSEDHIAIERALATLPGEQRRLIELAYFQGMTHAELAEHCALPLGTVKTRVRSGLTALRRELSRVSGPMAESRVS